MMHEIRHYDPQQQPDPQAWLAVDESERIALVRKHHQRAKVKLPNATLHATIHALVETQIAMGVETPVRETLERLQAEGLDRHDAIHAIGRALMNHMYDVLKGKSAEGDPNEPYWAELKQLTAEKWRHRD